MGNRPTLGAGLNDLFGPSETLWGDVPLDYIFGFKDRNIGWGVRDDFTNYALDIAIASNVGYPTSEGNVYRTFESVGGSGTSGQNILPSTTGTYTVPTGMPIYSPQGWNNPGLNSMSALYAAGAVIPTPGQITFTPTTTTDQGNIVLAPNSGTTNYGCFTPYPITSGVQGPVYFECRIKLSALATGITTFFIGLAGTGGGITAVPAGASVFAASLSSATSSLLGFGCVKGDTASRIGLVYSKASGAYTDGASASSTTLCTVGATPSYNGLQVVGNGQYFKLGFKYDPATGILMPFVNGIPQDGISNLSGPKQSLTSTQTASATLWPADPMTFAAGLYQTGSTMQTMTIDWYQIVQMAG